MSPQPSVNTAAAETGALVQISGLQKHFPIVRGLMRMCGDLGIQVIAEGIETAGERDALLDLGVRWMQGYLLAKPAFRALATVDAAAWPR